MYFQIKEVVLWPKNQEFAPRRLLFELGKVNVISGTSKTGKSAIIPIVDYCLGSDKCTIPVNTIRDTCEWFGILIQTINGQKLFARREPGEQKTTGDMFILEGQALEIPQKIEKKNSTVDIVKRMLDELVGLSALDFDANESSSGFRSRPSFRDMAAFIFQPQNIVANPDVFFYKADTYEHREKLRTIFPYILNAITPQLLAKRNQLSQLRKELKRKENELTTVKQVSEKWLAEIHSRVSEARELGLIKTSFSENMKREELVDLLESVVRQSAYEIKVTSETISDAVEELLGLQNEETEISTQLSHLRRRFIEMSELEESKIQYQGALQIQRDRLKISEWLRTNQYEHNCPLCGNRNNSAAEQLNQLYDSLKMIEQEAGEFNSTPAAFDREFERVRTDIRKISEKLQGVRMRREALEKTSSEAKDHQYETLRVSRFIGNLEESLNTYARLGTDSDLDKEIQDLKEQVGIIESEVAEGDLRKKVGRALAKVQAHAQRLLPGLDAERPDDPIILSIDDLTIKVQGNNRDDYLWELGSGSNWLAYHIAVAMGLQGFFMNLDHSPIPSFIIFDQPSQVYFPKKLAYQNSDENLDPKLTDQDLVAVRKVFSTLSEEVRRNEYRLQVIVLDHAPEDVWQNLEDVILIEEWRDGKTLVPQEWQV